MNQFFQNLLETDKNLLIAAQSVVPEQFAFLLKLTSESIVLWCMVFLVVLWLYGVSKKDDSYKIQSLKIFLLIISVFVVYGLIYCFLPQFRPHPGAFLNDTQIRPLIPHPLDNSFPSGHALFSSAFVVAVYYYTKNISILVVTILLALLTVCSRVLGGVHYPGDILWGIFFGSIAAVCFRPFVDIVVKKISPYILKIAHFIKL